jgi:hypothetical protein
VACSQSLGKNDGAIETCDKWNADNAELGAITLPQPVNDEYLDSLI